MARERGPTFGEAALGQLKAIAEWPDDRKVLAAAIGLGALVFLPYLGAVGLWDPWEPHYGEVARSMIQRHDYVYPWWESAWFFSKPPLTMWMQALGMQVVGTNRTNGPLALYTEWGMRLPFAIVSIAAVAMLSFAAARLAGRRVGLATALVLVTMPLYFLLTRQTVTDTPFVAFLSCAMACALLAQLDEKISRRAGLWYAFYVFCGLAMLAKGLMGAFLPGAILAVYAAAAWMPWDWQSLRSHGRWLTSASFRAEVNAGREPMPFLWGQLYRMHLLTGLGVFFSVAAPWLVVMCQFDGVDDEGHIFWYRYFIHDHFNRLMSGVHTTTPGGTFTYFIEQGGYAIFPWVVLIPGAIALAANIRIRGGDRRDHLALICVIWAAVAFLLVGASATKFHHYVFPVLPPLAVLLALYIDRLWETGIQANAVALALGLVLFILVGKDLASNPKAFTDLFVYNYDRPYPFEMVERQLALWSIRPIWSGDWVALLLVAIGVYVLYDGRSSKGRARLVTFALAIGSIACGVALFAALSSGVGSGPLGGLLYQPVTTKGGMGMAFTVGGMLCSLWAIARQKTHLFATFGALALGFALWFNWGHWVDLSHHWTQRDQFWRYYRLRRPDEPIAAFLMNWRGETFYSKNTVKQIRDNPKMTQYAQLPGRKWSLVEHNRLGILRSAVGPDKVVTPIDPGLNNKFVLVTIE